MLNKVEECFCKKSLYLFSLYFIVTIIHIIFPPEKNARVCTIKWYMLVFFLLPFLGIIFPKLNSNVKLKIFNCLFD
ncbi:MAG: hypothetical protein H6Q70_1879 [Firmicutes bacterium]|nr:hypothetical protein [Bacillota bacterium]